MLIYCPRKYKYYLIPASPKASLWAGLHDDVPDRPSAQAAPAGCQLATVALQNKTVKIPRGGLHDRSSVTQSGTSVHLD